jgi:CRP/FNR family cyclic AMP-dependent transcriptional regulator
MPPKPDLVATLRRLQLFTDLSEKELALVAENVSRLRYEEGAAIFSEGDPCHELLIVEVGTVKIFKSALDGREQLIGIERRGNSLAEVPVFDSGTYPRVQRRPARPFSCGYRRIISEESACRIPNSLSRSSRFSGTGFGT